LITRDESALHRIHFPDREDAEIQRFAADRLRPACSVSAAIWFFVGRALASALLLTVSIF